MNQEITWSIEIKSLADLTDHPKNPRQLSKLDAEHLKVSLCKFGLADKPIINTDGMIIGGHQRTRMLAELGFDEIECLVPSRTLTKEEVDEFNIRLNKNSGEWDFDILANEWDPENLIEWGFTEKELIEYPSIDTIEPDEPFEEKKKKEKTCPNCGHNF